MPTSHSSISLADAQRMLRAGEAAASRIAIPFSVAVVDAHRSSRDLVDEKGRAR